MNTANVAATMSTSGSAIDTTFNTNAGVDGQLLIEGGLSAKVLARRAEFLDDCEDWDRSGLADNYVIRWNKSDDTYMASERNLNGGSF